MRFPDVVDSEFTAGHRDITKERVVWHSWVLTDPEKIFAGEPLESDQPVRAQQQVPFVLSSTGIPRPFGRVRAP